MPVSEAVLGVIEGRLAPSDVVASLLAREQHVLFTPGRFFYFQAVQPNTLRLGFAGVNEKQIGQGIERGATSGIITLS